MIFAKTKKKEKEARQLRFIEGTLRSFLRDAMKAREYDHGIRFIPTIAEVKKFDEMIEIRAKEIRDWL